MKKILLSSLLLPGIAFATDEAELETVNVTAKGFSNSLNTALRDYHVIEVNESNSHYASLADLLSDVPGVHATQLTNRSQRQTLSIDGLSLDKTLILINGQQIGSATAGEASLNTIPVNQIERIEVMKGSGAALYGASALSGVINIITKSEQSTSITASSASQNNVSTQFQHSHVISNFINTGVSWTYEKADGISAREGEWSKWGQTGTFDSDNDGFENHAINAYVDVNPTNELSIRNSVFKTTGRYDYDSETSDDQATFNNSQFVSSLNYTKGSISTNVAASRQTDSSINYGVTSTRKDADEFTTISDGVTAQAMYQSQNFEVITGAEWQNDHVGKSDTDYDKTNIVSRSNYVMTTLSVVDFVTLSAGSRRDTTNAYGTHLTYNTSAEFFKGNHSVIVSQQSGYQTPTFNDLYWPDAGNPDLQPEISKSKFIKYAFNSENTTVGVKLLRHDLKNLIDWAEDSNGDWAPENVDTSTIESTQINWSQNWTESIASTLVTEKVIATNNETEQRLAQVPEYESSAKLDYSLPKFSVFAKANFVGVRLDSAQKETLMPYTTYDLGVSSKPAKSLTTSLVATNILDRDYTPNSSYVNKPLTVKGTVSYQF